MLDPLRGTGGTFGAMAITNANHATSSGRVYTNGTNTWGDGKQYIDGGSTTDANGQTAAVNAMWGLMNTYDLHKNVLGWHSLDGNNTATYIAAHVNRGYDNAYYSDTCRCMFIGDGTFFTSLGSIDVIGHEMGHGVTAATSNLLYFGRIGRPERIEFGHRRRSGRSLCARRRHRRRRARGGQRLDAGHGDQPARQAAALDVQAEQGRQQPGRLEHGSQAPRRALQQRPEQPDVLFPVAGFECRQDGRLYSDYLTRKPAAMTGIGIDKAFRIWFRANTTKFTASTNYADARAKMIESAQELYGAGSREAVAVSAPMPPSMSGPTSTNWLPARTDPGSGSGRRCGY